MIHLVGSVSWNSNGWVKPGAEADRARSGFGNVRGGYVGNESWNFSRDDHVHGGLKYGSVENIHRATRFRSGSGIVFFWSRGPVGNVFVGCYAMASLLASPQPLVGVKTLEFNVTVPSEPTRLICVFTQMVPCLPERHLRAGNVHKQHPGQIGFCYIDDEAAAAIVNDALGLGNEEARGIKELYRF